MCSSFVPDQLCRRKYERCVFTCLFSLIVSLALSLALYLFLSRLNCSCCAFAPTIYYFSNHEIIMYRIHLETMFYIAIVLAPSLARHIRLYFKQKINKIACIRGTIILYTHTYCSALYIPYFLLLLIFFCCFSRSIFRLYC